MCGNHLFCFLQIPACRGNPDDAFVSQEMQRLHVRCADRFVVFEKCPVKVGGYQPDVLHGLFSCCKNNKYCLHTFPDDQIFIEPATFSIHRQNWSTRLKTTL